MDNYTLKIQKALKAKGYNPGPSDGIMGPKTSRAIIAFKVDNGLRARDLVGPITAAILFDNKKAPQGGSDSEPAWMRRARQDIGVREISGYRHNAKILGYWEAIKASFRDDETPWCAGFVGAMLEYCGIKSSRSAAARSYSWGGFRKLKKPIPGAIVVFWRKSMSSGLGHVGFLDSVDRYGNPNVLGGNQGDEVNIKPFSKSRLVGYYWPNSVPVPGEDAQVKDTGGAFSNNEA